MKRRAGRVTADPLKRPARKNGVDMRFLYGTSEGYFSKSVVWAIVFSSLNPAKTLSKCRKEEVTVSSIAWPVTTGEVWMSISKRDLPSVFSGIMTGI